MSENPDPAHPPPGGIFWSKTAFFWRKTAFLGLKSGKIRGLELLIRQQGKNANC
jgi:hypothetical protein